MTPFKTLTVFAASLALAACASGGTLDGANVATGADAYRVLSAPQNVVQPVPPGVSYRIAAHDALSVAVFQEPELSTPADSPLQVDASGNISLPLIGSLTAAGKTTDEMAALIASQLRGRYLKNPQVTVSVASSAPKKLTVQGEVEQPGVFDIKGRTSLLEAIAMARGETRLAATNQVAVFRNVNGQRMGALFDMNAIRRGAAPDPELLANDVVIVGHSKGRQMWQDVLSVTPLFGVFRVIGL
jgi:polysaccharide export outer membrane protein